MDHYSTYTRIQRVTAWMLRFTQNCQSHKRGVPRIASYVLTVQELTSADYYFHKEILLPRMSRLLKKVVRLHDPVASYLCIAFLDSSGLLRVGGRPSCLTTANTLLLFMGSTC